MLSVPCDRCSALHSSDAPCPHPKDTRVVHCKRDGCDVYIGRGSPYGNPYPMLREDRRDYVIQAYREWVLGASRQGKKVRELIQRGELTGKTLGCFCVPRRCHGDVLVELVLRYCGCEAVDLEGSGQVCGEPARYISQEGRRLCRACLEEMRKAKWAAFEA